MPCSFTCRLSFSAHIGPVQHASHEWANQHVLRPRFSRQGRCSHPQLPSLAKPGEPRATRCSERPLDCSHHLIPVIASSLDGVMQWLSRVLHRHAESSCRWAHCIAIMPSMLSHAPSCSDAPAMHRACCVQSCVTSIFQRPGPHLA